MKSFMWNVGEINIRLNFTKICVPSNITPAHGVWQTTAILLYQLTVHLISVNSAIYQVLFAVCLIKFAKKKLFIICVRKRWWNQAKGSISLTFYAHHFLLKIFLKPFCYTLLWTNVPKCSSWRTYAKLTTQIM